MAEFATDSGLTLAECIDDADARSRDAALSWDARSAAEAEGRALRLRLVNVLSERAAARSPRQLASGVDCFVRASALPSERLDDLIAALAAADIDDTKEQ